MERFRGMTQIRATQKEEATKASQQLSLMSWKSGVFHNPSGLYVRPWPADLGSKLKLLVRTPHGAPVDRVFVRSAPDGEQQMSAARRVPERAGWDCLWWECPVSLANPNFHYRFLLLGSEGGWWLNASGLWRWNPTDQCDFRLLAGASEPAWLDTSVFYQIFPERFENGDPSLNVRSDQYLVDGKPTVAKAWGKRPNRKQGWREFYGGDLIGIENRLDHLDMLGVNALYLNPIGTAPSSHKYDVASYTEVDPHFGGESAFLSLRRATRERGIRLMLDIIPNHCGQTHPWFQRAVSDPKAKEAEFFSFSKHPHAYECWLGHKSLPKLNYASSSLREAMYQGPRSIMRHWLKPPFDIDGWRVDVANMLARHQAEHMGHKILRGMRRAVKEEKPDCYFLGENFFDATSYLQGDQLDATMNYSGFMMPLYHWLTGQDFSQTNDSPWGDSVPLPSEDLVAQWTAFRSAIPWSVACRGFNILGSHDTPRLLTVCRKDKDLAAVARLLLFTFPGVPCLYYGDEIAMVGGRDPDNRRTMEWRRERWDLEWLQGWRTLISLRRQLQALQKGSFQVLLAKDHTLAFMREHHDARVVVVAKRQRDGNTTVSLQDAAVPDGTVFCERLSKRKESVQSGTLPLLDSKTQIWQACPL